MRVIYLDGWKNGHDFLTLTFHMMDHLLKEDLRAFVTNLQLRDSNRWRTLHELPLIHKLLQLQFTVIHLGAVGITKITVIEQCQALTHSKKDENRRRLLLLDNHWPKSQDINTFVFFIH